MSQGRVFQGKQQKPLQKEKERIKEELKKGYSQMADLNLRLAQEGFKADKEAYRSFCY